jgi:hypothetical protein
VLIAVGRARAQKLAAVEKECTIARAKAASQLSQCLAKVEIKDAKKDLSKDEVDRIVAQCKAKIGDV